MNNYYRSSARQQAALCTVTLAYAGAEGIKELGGPAVDQAAADAPKVGRTLWELLNSTPFIATVTGRTSSVSCCHVCQQQVVSWTGDTKPVFECWKGGGGGCHKREYEGSNLLGRSDIEAACADHTHTARWEYLDHLHGGR